MTYELTEEIKRFLTEKVLGECFTTDGDFDDEGICKKCRQCVEGHELRTFTLGQDMLDIRKALRDSGEWDEFIIFIEKRLPLMRIKEIWAYLDSDTIRHNVLVGMYFKEKEIKK